MRDRENIPAPHDAALPAEIDEMEESRMARKKQHKRHEIRGWVFSIAAAVVIALLLRFFVFEFIRVEGPSMEDTLQTNEYVFMEKMSYRFSEPQRGDIVICSFPNHSQTYVKRIVAIEGDTIEISDGELYINGKQEFEYYDYYEHYDPITQRMSDMPAKVVPQNAVFVMGDNRTQSMDSRDSTIGALPYSMIRGKAVFIIWPLSKIQGL